MAASERRTLNDIYCTPHKHVCVKPGLAQIMGLAAGFKQFVSARLPTAVLPREPEEVDAVLTDAPCILHSFSSDPREPIPAGHSLFARLKRDAIEGVPVGGTAVVCFDRYSETPVAKHIAHKKRRLATREWTTTEVQVGSSALFDPHARDEHCA